MRVRREYLRNRLNLAASQGLGGSSNFVQKKGFALAGFRFKLAAHPADEPDCHLHGLDFPAQPCLAPVGANGGYGADSVHGGRNVD